LEFISLDLVYKNFIKTTGGKNLLTELFEKKSNKYLYIAYLIFFILMFFSNDIFLGANYFLIILAPLSLIPASLNYFDKDKSQRSPHLSFNFLNTLQTLNFARSSIFVSIVIFIIMISLSSWLQPQMTAPWGWRLAQYGGLIALFLLITARLVFHAPEAIGCFFLILCPVVALQCSLNLILYFNSLKELSNSLGERFGPTYGHIPDHYPTTGSLIYGLFLVSGVILSFEKNNLLNRISLAVSSCIFSAALIFSQSRGSILAVLLTLLIWSFFSSKKVQKIVVSLSILSVGLFLSIPKIGDYALSRLDRFRFWVWERFFNLAKERPLLGYGERIEFWIYLPNGEHVGHAHNLLLSAIVRGGIFAGLALMYALIRSLYVNFSYMRQGGSALPFCLILLMLISGLVDYDLLVFHADWQWCAFWMPIGVSVGVEALMSEKTRASR
jgi:O-antigen ligase